MNISAYCGLIFATQFHTMRVATILLISLCIFFVYVNAGKPPGKKSNGAHVDHRLDGKKAKKEIGKIAKNMQSTLLLQKKAKQIKKAAKKEEPKKKTEKIQMAKKMEKIAVAKKKKAVKEAKKAIAKSPLEALKSLRKMKKNGSQLKKKSAQLLAKNVAKEHKKETKKLGKKTPTRRMKQLEKIAAP